MWDGSGNWTHWIDKLSRSLTNTICTTWPVSNSIDSRYYAGQVSITQSYVHVRWAWLAFPAAMLLASLVFLLASMWQTHRSNTHAWKDSALVLLSVALEPDIWAMLTPTSTNQASSKADRRGKGLLGEA
jgi:hypothetical protein